MSEAHSYLVVFDTDRIKEYVFATNRLREIRGASALLNELNRKERIEEILAPICQTEVVYAAGGSATVLVPDEASAKLVIAAIEKHYRQQTVAASITGACLEPSAANGTCFGERVKQAGQRLRDAKAQKAELAILPVEPYLRLCDSCGRYPATTQEENNNDSWLCSACHIKQCKGEYGLLYDGFCSSAGANSQWTRENLPEDLDDIGAVSRPLNYVGFIAADGNRMGDLLCQMRDKSDYGGYSEALDRLVREELTFGSLREHGQPRSLVSSEKRVAPFEIILVGGDDVLLIAAADIAIEIALSITMGFQERGPEVLKKWLNAPNQPMTMATGVVLAHADFPIAAAHELAKELQGFAKKHCARGGYTEGAVDFLVVSGSDADLESARATIPHRRPYSLQELRTLLNYVRQLKELDFPTSQLQAMYQSLFAGKVTAEMASIAALGRLKQQRDARAYKTLRGFFSKFGVKFDGQLPPWDAAESVKGHHVSALTDLVELYPFIQLRGADDGAHQG
jgi:hypothetical protein